MATASAGNANATLFNPDPVIGTRASSAIATTLTACSRTINSAPVSYCLPCDRYLNIGNVVLACKTIIVLPLCLPCKREKCKIIQAKLVRLVVIEICLPCKKL